MRIDSVLSKSKNPLLKRSYLERLPSVQYSMIRPQDTLTDCSSEKNALKSKVQNIPKSSTSSTLHENLICGQSPSEMAVAHVLSLADPIPNNPEFHCTNDFPLDIRYGNRFTSHPVSSNGKSYSAANDQESTYENVFMLKNCPEGTCSNNEYDRQHRTIHLPKNNSPSNSSMNIATSSNINHETGSEYIRPHFSSRKPFSPLSDDYVHPLRPSTSRSTHSSPLLIKSSVQKRPQAAQCPEETIELLKNQRI